MTRSGTPALYLAGLLTGASFVPAFCSGQTLERVVIVERHGVRAPSNTPEALSAFSIEPWPEWPAAPGDLTPHGTAALQLMGAWLRKIYPSLLPAGGCPPAGSVFVWADGKDRRTVESGDAVLSGLAAECGLAVSHGPAGQSDPVFDAMATGFCPLDAPAASRSVLAATADGLAVPIPGYVDSMAALHDLLDPPVARKTCAGDPERCFENGVNSFSATDKSAKIEGPLAIASMLGEALALEYDEGFSGKQFGWGRLDQRTLGQIMMLHNGYTGLTRRNPVIAGHNGARLAQALLAMIDGKVAFPGQGQPARLSIVLGHDTTIANLAGMLGVEWTLPGQSDDTPPDGAIVFEVYRAPAGHEPQVKMSMLYQTADQLRHLVALGKDSPPGRIALSPACEDGRAGSCTIRGLRSLLSKMVPPPCRLP